MKKLIEIKNSPNGNKIYIYNPKYVESQSKKKFNKILKQHALFKKIKKCIKINLNSKNIFKKETAIVLYLIIHCGFRIGNKRYEDKSYGISTIKFKHITNICNTVVKFDFIGKKGVRNIGQCNNKAICKYLNKKKMNYNSNDYVFPTITSSVANNYLKTFDEELTSKDLRTWVANILFVKYALNTTKDAKAAKATKAAKSGKNTDSVKRTNVKKAINHAIKKVSEQLHNTPAVCKKNYIDINIVRHVEEILKNDKRI